MAGAYKTLTMVIVFTAIALVSSACWGGEWDLKKTKNKQVAQNKVLAYVAEHDGKRFEFMAALKNLDISQSALTAHLLDLERAGKIKITPQSLSRKPILITLEDMRHYFWVITIVP